MSYHPQQEQPHERHPRHREEVDGALHHHEGSPLIGPPTPAEMVSNDAAPSSDPQTIPESPSKFKSLVRHFSMDYWTDNENARGGALSPSSWSLVSSPVAASVARLLRPGSWSPTARKYGAPFLVTVLAVIVWSGRQWRGASPAPAQAPTQLIVPIDSAREAMLDLGGGMQMWYRTWGNRRSGVPVLFVHGGPGNCIADYANYNSHFFEADLYFVVEADQRGTGRSTPSVRDSCRAMEYYRNISIDKMSADFEVLREALGIEQWLVFGGSWGSTLSLDYGERYPSRCLGLILRGIFLNTRPEFDDVFSRNSYLANPKRLAEFDTWFELAAQDARDHDEEELDPNDAERFFRVYERMIGRCDREAIWRYHVFEYNLMEEDPDKLLDPHRILESTYPEAQSVAFFEARLFLHGTFEDPVDLLKRVPHLLNNDQKKGGGDDPPTSASAPVKTWICQGHRDEVCPERYAKKLAKALQGADVPTKARFIDAGHEASNPVMTDCLKVSLEEFLEGQQS